jgi:hypothetical protein
MSTLTSFPADDPVWNTGGLNRTTPIDAKQALGWIIGEEPPSGYYNWWQFYVWKYIEHYKVTAAALNDGKIDRDGGNTVTGNILPDANATRDLGSIGTRFDDVFVDKLDTNTLEVNTGVNTSLIPLALGYNLGDDGDPWTDIWARTIRTKTTMASLSSDDSPSTSLDLISMNQTKSILACGSINGVTGALISGFNCASSAFTVNPGIYRVTLDVAVDDNAAVVVTCSTADHTAAAQIVTSGTQVTVHTRDGSGYVNSSFTFIIVGSPRTLVTDTIS